MQREAERARKKQSTVTRKRSEDARGEFDDLVSALKTGEVFEKDGNKFQKRNRQRRNPNLLDSDRERVGKITTHI